MAALCLLALAVLAAAWFLRPQAREDAGGAFGYDRPGRPRRDPEHAAAGRLDHRRRFMNIGAPVLQAPDTGRGLTLIFLAASGTRVKEGDLIAEIDSQDIKDHLVDVEASLSQAKLDIARRKAMLVAQMEGLNQRLRVAKATMERARLDARAIPVAEHDHPGDSATRRRGISGSLRGSRQTDAAYRGAPTVGPQAL